MIHLEAALNAWRTPEFETVVKRELEGLDAGDLPLQAGLTRGSYVGETPFRVILLNANEEGTSLRAKIGLFYTGIIAGCSCADDPTPVDEHTEYCEVRVDIDLATAQATFTLVSDD